MTDLSALPDPLSRVSDPPAGLLTFPDTAASISADPEPDCVVLMASRGGDGLGMSFKVSPSGRVFRLEPARDPDQPRFWCFRVYRCTAAGIADENERSWWGAGGMTRNDLAGAVETIRNDPNAWLANDALVDLRDWIMEPGVDPITPARQLGARQKQIR